MIRTLHRAALAAAFTVFAAGAALAGPQYVDETGFAVSGYDVVEYRNLEQAPVGEPQPRAVLGSAEFTAEYNGATWAFASAENRDLFLTNPEFYAPVYDGHCAYGVSRGGKVPANPHLWRIIDDRLYLNITENVVGFWEANIPGNIEQSESNWPGIAENAASTNTIPNYSSPGPVGAETTATEG